MLPLKDASTTPLHSHPTVLVLAKRGLWESDFLQEIIPIEPARWHWIPVRQGRLRGLIRCVGRVSQDRCGVLVFNSNDLFYPEISLYTRLLKPKVLIHLSDEWGTRSHYSRLANHVGLLVRQHHHGKYSEPKNVAYMPLGYMIGLVGGQNTTGLHGLPPLSNRPHIWAFAGNPNKHDRQEVLRYFAEWRSGVRAQNMTPPEMFELYRNSVF